METHPSPACAFGVGGYAGGNVGGTWTKRRRHVVRAACLEFVFDFVFSFFGNVHFVPSRDKVKDVRFCTGVRVSRLCPYSFK
ncbi:MAG: hypothetical protein ACKOBL_08455, partial [Chloroflexota bacterium]